MTPPPDSPHLAVTGRGETKLGGKPWPHKVDARGQVSRGLHTLECGGKVAFTIARGTTFYFDDGGP
jgi:hypothetical protein